MRSARDSAKLMQKAAPFRTVPTCGSVQSRIQLLDSRYANTALRADYPNGSGECGIMVTGMDCTPLVRHGNFCDRVSWRMTVAAKGKNR